MATRKLKEYWITIAVQVEALDEEQVKEICKDLLTSLRKDHLWNVLFAEVTDIEEA